MSKNNSASLGNYFEGFVEYRIYEGRYKNEVIRAGLRLLEEEENKIMTQDSVNNINSCGGS
jgi:antitoxin ParD1/3/4